MTFNTKEKIIPPCGGSISNIRLLETYRDQTSDIPKVVILIDVTCTCERHHTMSIVHNGDTTIEWDKYSEIKVGHHHDI
jgi:hypothetical protein